MAEHLRASARRRHDNTVERATAALARLSAAGKAITFAAVAREGRVSTDFLYRQPSLRLKIQELRTTNRARTTDEVPDSTLSKSPPVLALSSQLKELKRRHHLEVAKRKNALAVAHGETLTPRRRLAFYEPI